jgi:hypothetical protein
MVEKLVQEVYKTSDGKVFTNIVDAEKHEASVKNIKYFRVRYGADLTEGRGWLESEALIEVNTNGKHKDFAEILCYSIFGSPYNFVMGAFGSNAILPYWRIDGEVKEPNLEEVKFAVEERFAQNKKYGEGLWDLRNGKQSIKMR